MKGTMIVERAGRALPIAMVTTLCVGVVSACVPSPRSPSTAGRDAVPDAQDRGVPSEPSAEPSIEPSTEPSADPSPDVPLAAHYLPCTPGVEIEYRFSQKADRTVTDRVRGREGPLCLIDRVTSDASSRPHADVLARELLPDRVVDAGWLSHLTAFRPPLLVEPIADGHRWRFNRSEYEIIEVDARVEVPAGVFSPCVRVRQRARDAAGFEAEAVYAEGVGLILSRRGGARMEAVRVVRPDRKSTSAQKASRTPRSVSDVR